MFFDSAIIACAHDVATLTCFEFRLGGFSLRMDCNRSTDLTCSFYLVLVSRNLCTSSRIFLDVHLHAIGFVSFSISSWDAVSSSACPSASLNGVVYSPPFLTYCMHYVLYKYTLYYSVSSAFNMCSLLYTLYCICDEILITVVTVCQNMYFKNCALVLGLRTMEAEW